MMAHFGVTSHSQLQWGDKWPFMVRLMADQSKPGKSDYKKKSMQDLRDKVNQIKAGL